MKRQAWSLANLWRPKRLTTATSPVRAPVEPIQAPVEPIQAPVAPIKAPPESNKTSDEAENSAKSSDDHGLFDPVAKSTSWKPSTSFSTFLDTNFRRKLLYQQSLVIMHDWATPLLQNSVNNC